ncbi:MAG: hypothetical protein LUG89_03785 [Methanosphaera sp.]|nr:hypothetical protein [Methanosphaera sp.]
MPRILRVILFIVAILVVFEVGLFASYALISPSTTDPGEIISTQIEDVTDFVESLFGETELNSQDSLNITNEEEVGLMLNNLTNLSVDISSLSAKVSTSDTGNQTVTITATASGDVQSSTDSGIQILTGQRYSITATATGEVYSTGRVEIDVDTIQVTEQIVLYNQNNTTNINNSSIDNLVNYTQNTSSQNNTTVATNTQSNTSSRARA